MPLTNLYSKLSELLHCTFKSLDTASLWLAMIPMRLLLAWEFWESGWEKYTGENWFADIQDRFPFPFNLVPTDFSWWLSTWAELVCAIMLVFGLGTRLASITLFILTIVAIGSVHWPTGWQSFNELLMGYALTDKGFGNYKLPLIFLIMLFPLILHGGGKLSLDYWIHRLWRQRSPASDAQQA